MSARALAPECAGEPKFYPQSCCMCAARKPSLSAFFFTSSPAAGKAVQTGHSRAAVTGDIVHRTRFENTRFGQRQSSRLRAGEGRPMAGARQARLLKPGVRTSLPSSSMPRPSVAALFFLHRTNEPASLPGRACRAPASIHCADTPSAFFCFLWHGPPARDRRRAESPCPPPPQSFSFSYSFSNPSE